MARYLKSTTTNVVLPYNDKLLKRPNIKVMSKEECTAYEASVKARLNGTTVDAHPDIVEPTVAAEPTPAIETLPDEDEVVVEQPVIEASDISEGEPTAEELLAALEVD